MVGPKIATHRPLATLLRGRGVPTLGRQQFAPSHRLHPHALGEDRVLFSSASSTMITDVDSECQGDHRRADVGLGLIAFS